MSQALLQALRAAIGADHVLTEGDLSAWELDWRKRYRGRALAVLRPADTAQVAAVLRACAAHGASVVPQGGNTGLVGGGVPDASGTPTAYRARLTLLPGGPGLNFRVLDATPLP